MLRRPQPALRVISGVDAPVDPVRRAPVRADLELAARVRRGDARASRELCDRVFPRVEGMVRRLLGHADPDADDLAQNAMVEIVTSIDGYRGDSPLEAWASSITAHCVYQNIRHRKVHRQLFAGAEAGEDFRAASGTMEIAVARDLVGRIRKHLGAMEEDKAWTFLLHDVCGFDLREIARITGASVAAAQSRLVRGRREIHERIACDPELADLLDEEDPS